MKSVSRHSKLENSKHNPSLAGSPPYHRCRSYGWGPAKHEMFQENFSRKNKKQKYFCFFFFLLRNFKSQRAPSHSLGTKAMAWGLPNLKCFKKFKERQNLFILFYFLKFFKNRRAPSYSLGTKAMAGCPSNLKCFKKIY
jgi:hypothetical protein